jgi:hypothetical protein
VDLQDGAHVQLGILEEKKNLIIIYLT